MIENGTGTQDSTQAAQTKDLNQRIAAENSSAAPGQPSSGSSREALSFHEHAYRALQREMYELDFDKRPLDSGRLEDGRIVDLVRDAADDRRLKFIYRKPAVETDARPRIFYRHELPSKSGPNYVPPEVEPSLLQSIELPFEAEPYKSLTDLLANISQLILRCVSVTETDARLLAHFVLSTWLIDQLPVAPYLALVGPPQSGKTTLLRVLHLLCRRSLFASDATSITLVHACHQLHPTLLIDETSSIDDPVAMRRLLRIGNTPGSLVLRHKQAWNVFGAKVICWRELPDDAALNSRCIILPMHAVNDPALRLPDDPEILDATATLQSQLLYYRLANYDRIATPAITDAVKNLPPRKREMYLALAAPCMNDQSSQNFLLDYFHDDSRSQDEDALSAAEYSVLLALFHLAHMPEHRAQPLTKEIAARANRYLHDEREHFQLHIRRVGAILTGFGYVKRRRTKKGWALDLEGNDQRRLHRIAERYGIDRLRDDMPGFTACLLCPDAPPAAQPFAVGVVSG